ncbi:hypothetical protein EV356DRAFT_537928 [Viridothelium virens]|uniref:Rhodopsin domain-containing protein n=1 Tax=Viridothelium virens TaxID=1048519 RepID=A0A6A6GT10_VIRVR|nr:hypothetical protein EV356DRAFT_537928 [Viridothelium virens]
MSTPDHPPDSLLAQYPLVPPPPGVESNFIDPPNFGKSFIIFGGVILPTMLVLLVVRLHTKFRIIGQRSWDDLTSFLAAFGAITHWVITTLAITKGKYGRHAWDISVLDSVEPWFAVNVYILNWFATLILPFAKITFFIFYLQLFRPFKWLRILCYAGLVFTAITFPSFLIAQLALATPHPGESWLEMGQDPRDLKPLHYLSIPITATSFGIDIYTFVLPMLGLAKLKLSGRRKLGVFLVFLTGFAACISSFFGLYYKIRLNNTADATWVSIPVNICLLSEISVGVIASCMPSLSKLVRSKFPDFSIIDSLLSFKMRLFGTGRSSSSTTPLASDPHKHPFKNLNEGEPREISREASSFSSIHDIELGGHLTTKTRIAGSGAIEMNPLNGIPLPGD